MEKTVLTISGKEIVDNVKKFAKDLAREVKEAAKDSGVDEKIKKIKKMKVVIKNKDGKKIISVPLVVGVTVTAVGTITTPVLTVLSALAGVMKKCTLEVVEKEEAA